ncbi:hypothetical protein Dsin_026335 [Dipteronia sinensis]|uniref:Uncharacterized protein n=1 Tax=Dipteronia sinensis TaxID=43782 RepID=A0AAD9ZXT7_9ROSI|nr:hypothetical protein Dsin_026335 [Dipteronia sinensis]
MDGKETVSDSDASSYTKDGSLDYHGQPAVKWRTGGWRCGLLLLGNGAPEPALAIFGADQFDEEDPKEKQLKSSFYSYFHVALNLGCLFSKTVLAYVENIGYWVLGFWICTGCAIFAFLLLLSGTFRYRRFRPSGNPLSRFSQVIVASLRKINLQVPSSGEELYEVYQRENETIKLKMWLLIFPTSRFLDRAAIMTPVEMTMTATNNGRNLNPWQLCTITQVEEVKCILRLLPVWLCTILSSLAFTQMIGLFIEQGAAMDTKISNFQIPPASMTNKYLGKFEAEPTKLNLANTILPEKTQLD